MLYAEVYYPSGQRAGYGPVLVKSASINRTLDGPGSYSCEVNYTQENEALLKIERRIYIYKTNGDNEDRIFLFAGVIRKARRKYSVSASISVDGPELIDELKNTSVLLNRQYSEAPLSTVAQSLAGLAGWTIVTSATNTISARYDGTTVLKALQEIIRDTGLHLRATDNPRQIEIGAFGDWNGLTLVNVDSALVDSDDVAIITDLTMEEDGENIINWLLPVGAGEGEAALTLKNSTRTGVLSMVGADGRNVYYLQNSDSIAKYGTKQKVGIFKNIAPLNNSATAKVIAANALTDAGTAFLQRSGEPIRRYNGTLKQCPINLKAGDTVRVIYRGLMRAEDDDVFETIDSYLYVMKVSESHSDGGASVNVELANVDKVKSDAAKVIVGALENLEVRNLKPQAYPYWSENTYTDIVSNHTNPTYSRWADFKIEIDNSVLEITRVRLRVKTLRLFTYSAVRLEPGAVTVNAVPYVSPGLFPTQFYSIVESDDYPSGITFYFNGVDVSAAFGGPWNVGLNVQTDITLDVTDLILSASGGMYQSHSIQFRCENRQGNCTVPGMPVSITSDVSHGIVECNIRIQGTCQAIISS